LAIDDWSGHSSIAKSTNQQINKSTNPKMDSNDPVDGPVKVVDRRRWAHGEDASADAAARKPSYVEELERLLAEKDKAIQAHASRYRESAGEFEQVRARLRRDMDKEIERARRALLADFLEVVDNLDRALTAARDARSDTGGPDASCTGLIKGVELVRDLLLAKLTSYGVKPVAAEGEPFDPRVHEAVSILPVTAPDQDERVVGVVRPGYTVNDDVLRPAAVVVGRASGS
jgi:molecular chaperone GrpE